MAWTDPRTWVTDELVTAAMMNSHVRDNLNAVPHLLARKTADQTVNASTTLVNDTHLSFAVGASEVWWFEGRIMCDGAATADIKFAWTVPASGTVAWGYLSAAPGDASWGQVTTGSTALALVTTSSALAAGMIGVGSVNGLAMAGIVTTAGTSGTAQLQWAQNASVASDTKVRTNSFLIGMQLA